MTIGQTIPIHKKRYGERNALYMDKRWGRVVQVCERFVAVHNGKYVECIWLDSDETNNPVLGDWQWLKSDT
jgi:hypothetical protein